MRVRRRPAVAVVAALASLTALTTAGIRPPSGNGPRLLPVAAETPRSGHDRGPGGAPLTLNPIVGDRSRPNIVTIMADDMRDDDLRYMPHVRRLIGDQGVRFVNSFSPQPLCCPARASFDTGEYTHNHGVWSHSPPYGFQALDDSDTLPVWLHRAGYNTVFFGKYLNGYGRQPTRDGLPSTRYVPPGWTDWRGSVDGVPSEPGSPVSGGTYHYFDTTLNDNGTLQPHQGQYQTNMLGRQAREIFRQYADSPKPLFLWASFVAPHHGLPRQAEDPPPMRRSDGRYERIRTPAVPRRVWGRFDSVIGRAPGLPSEQDVSDKPFFIRDLPPMTRQERAAVTEDDRQRAESLHVLDNQVARMMRTLRQTGQLDNTYVVFTSDNGYFQGEHRMRQGKILPYEPSLRTPTLVRGPGIPAGQTRTDPFTSIDFAPTFLQMAGARPEPSVDGKGLLGVARHGDQGWDRGFITETGPRKVAFDTAESDNFLVKNEKDSRFMHRPHGPSPLRFSQGVRTARYLYVEHASHEKELYDLRSDPYELTNVVHRKNEARVVRALAHVLDRLRVCKGAACRRPLPPFLRAKPGTDRPVPLDP